MKHLKMFGLLAMAAASLMAFAGSAYASNPVLTSPAGTEYTGTIDLSLAESFLMEASIIQATCLESTIHGTVTTNTNGVASGAITTLSFGNCPEATVDVLASGAFEVTSGGEVRLKENKVTVQRFGPSCIYGGGGGTKFGVLKGGTTATMQIEASLPKQPGSSFLCPGFATVEGKYKVTTPDTLIVD